MYYIIIIIISSSHYINCWLLGGPIILEVLQYQADPCREWSKLLPSLLVPKISLISKPSVGGRIRY